MINSNPNMRVQTRGNARILKQAGHQAIEVTQQKDGLVLRGDGFEHSIEVRANKVQISRLDGTHSTSFPGPAHQESYQQTNQRVALGVAAVMTGLPVLAFTGEKPEPVYVDLASRPGLGRRDDFSDKGGRFRVTSMEAELDGGFILHGTKSWDGKVMKLGPDGVKKGPETNLNDKRWSISRGHAFSKLSGTNFTEQVQSSLVDVWRSAGKPGSVEDATKTSADFFQHLYRPDHSAGYHAAHVESPRLLRTLNALPAEKCWKLIEDAVEKKWSTEEVAKRATKEFGGPYKSFPYSQLLTHYVNYPEGLFFEPDRTDAKA